MSSLRARLRIDPYVLALLAVVAIASVFPCRGRAATIMGAAADFGIALLFFLYGGRLPRHVIVAGMTQWRLQLVVLLATFVLFPVLGLGLRVALAPWMPASLLDGIVFLSVLPSTVQSSIAFTSIARGNVPAAICSATVSNLIGVFLTPLLVALLLEQGNGSTAPLDAVWKIVSFLLVPFVVGHALRPLIGGWLERNNPWLGYVDRGSILFIVYIAFSEGVVAGIWHRLPPVSLLVLALVAAVLLGVVMCSLTWLARRLQFDKEDEIAIVFCGSKKSLASGLPMAKLLFTGPSVGFIVLPLMLFHQLQLMVCAALARRYARRLEVPTRAC
jgi:sodium/bile acid cotransporter 7